MRQDATLSFSRSVISKHKYLLLILQKIIFSTVDFMARIMPCWYNSNKRKRGEGKGKGGEERGKKRREEKREENTSYKEYDNSARGYLRENKLLFRGGSSFCTVG